MTYLTQEQSIKIKLQIALTLHCPKNANLQANARDLEKMSLVHLLNLIVVSAIFSETGHLTD